MVAKSELKLIKSLQQKKYRKQHGLFVVEGKKVVQELLEAGCSPFKIFATAELLEVLGFGNTTVVSAKELQQISALKNPNGVLGVFYQVVPTPVVDSDWVLVLDDIQDPGNLGTIIRLADWFGIQDIVCGLHTVDCYNPKVLQATMGSIARVQITYLDVSEFLAETDLPIYGAFMQGETLYNTALPKKGILILGNEGSGISNTVSELCDTRISIPQYGVQTTESLNVATAAAILLSEIRSAGKRTIQT